MSVSSETLAVAPGDASKASLLVELLRFGLVGGSGVVGFVGLSNLAIGLHTGLAAWIVSVLCYAAMIIPVYLGHHRFSFRSPVPHSKGLPRYVAVQIGALTLAAIFSYALYSVAKLPTFYASVLVTGLTSGATFVVLRLWAFAKPK
jgi:putative flippase GtrA